MSQQRLNHLAVLRVYRDRLYSIDIDVIAREFVAKSENRLATFGRIRIALHFALSLQHPTSGHSVRLNYIWYYVCMRYYNIYLEHTMHAIYEHP